MGPDSGRLQVRLARLESDLAALEDRLMALERAAGSCSPTIPGWLPVLEIASIFGVDAHTVYVWMSRYKHTLTICKRKSRRYVSVPSLIAFVEEHDVGNEPRGAILGALRALGTPG